MTVPKLYLDDIAQIFVKENPRHLEANWRRLVNEYGPRLAIMLSVTHDIATQTRQVNLTDRCWEGAGKLVLWFFAHAEKLLSNVMDIGEYAKNREYTLRRILNTIMKFPRGARWSDISNYATDWCDADTVAERSPCAIPSRAADGSTATTSATRIPSATSGLARRPGFPPRSSNRWCCGNFPRC